RRVIDNGIPASEQVGALVLDGGPSLTTDLSNLASTARTLAPRTIALQPLLIFMPGLAAGIPSAIEADGPSQRQGLVLETNAPFPCTVGYEGTMAILDEMKRKDPNFDDTQQDFPV
ncbi:mammalian cell entry protein, partial [Rhodococcus erythropolis]|nr:mammalian cell entry protein [Rhodococcus erythropolis]